MMPKYCIIFTSGVNQQSMSVEFTHKPVVMQAGGIRHCKEQPRKHGSDRWNFFSISYMARDISTSGLTAAILNIHTNQLLCRLVVYATVKGSPENMDLAAGISFLSHIWPEILVLPV